MNKQTTGCWALCWFSLASPHPYYFADTDEGHIWTQDAERAVGFESIDAARSMRSRMDYNQRVRVVPLIHAPLEKEKEKECSV